MGHWLSSFRAIYIYSSVKNSFSKLVSVSVIIYPCLETLKKCLVALIATTAMHI